jgi:nucleoside-diphosphate-sugar epimerase
MKKRILILGFGALGQTLVRYHADRYEFRGIKRSKIGNPPCSLFYQPIRSPELVDHLRWADHVVFCPAPAGDDAGLYRDVYLENMGFLVAQIQEKEIPTRSVLLIGSTGIYPNSEGPVWTEESPIHAETPRQEVLLQTEQGLIQSGIPYVIFRCGGLYGEGKGNFRERLAQGKITTAMMTRQYVHFIHLKDVCAAIDLAMEKGITGEVYNAVDDSEIRRVDFYRFLGKVFKIAIADGGPPRDDLPDRRISNAKIKTRLGLKFTYPKITGFLRSMVEEEKPASG